MTETLSRLSPLWLTIIASTFTYGMTALGAATVFFFKTVNRKALDFMMGVSAGVMIAAAYFSLLAPAIALSTSLGATPYLMPAVGFFCGGMFVLGAGKLLDNAISERNGSGKSLKRSILLVTSVTLHNIPEGLSVGVEFGAIALGVNGCEPLSAALLAIGIGIQNFPEGASVALPLRRENFGRLKAFFYGQASGIVEPIAAVIGYFLSTAAGGVLPFALSFSAGAMIAVSVGELIPEAAEHKNLAVLGSILGFLVMMTLDVALG